MAKTSDQVDQKTEIEEVQSSLRVLETEKLELQQGILNSQKRVDSIIDEEKQLQNRLKKIEKENEKEKEEEEEKPQPTKEEEAAAVLPCCEVQRVQEPPDSLNYYDYHWMVRSSLTLPASNSMMIMAMTHYVSNLMMAYNAFKAFTSSDWKAAGMFMVGLILPRVTQSMNIWAYLGLNEKTKPTRNREALMILLNLDMAASALRMKRGGTIDWLAFSTYQGTMATCAHLPSAAGAFQRTLNVNIGYDMGESMSDAVLLLTLFSAMIMAPISGTRWHHLPYGSPGNLEKYRLWDQPGSGRLTPGHLVAVRVIDCTLAASVISGMALVYSCGGAVPMLILFTIKIMMLYWVDSIGLALVPNAFLTRFGKESIAIGVAFFAFTFMRWHECLDWPLQTGAIPVYAQIHIVMNLWVGLVIGQNWSNAMQQYNHTNLYLGLGFWIATSLFSSIAYPVYVKIVRGKEHMHCTLKSKMFVKFLCEASAKETRKELGLEEPT